MNAKNPIVSGAIFTDSTNFVECPRCKQLPGVVCKLASCKSREIPHRQRVEAYRHSLSNEEFQSRHLIS